MQITVVHHPLLQVKMSVLRDLNTNCPTFRRVIGEVAMLLTFEATKNIPLKPLAITFSTTSFVIRKFFSVKSKRVSPGF